MPELARGKPWIPASRVPLRSRRSIGKSYAVALLAALAIFVLRRPDIVTNAQFWAEDGRRWYADYYNNGLSALIVPRTGYLQTFSRVVLGISTYLPLLWAPLFANSIGVLVRGLVVAYLFSGRFSWVSIGPRIILATYMLLMPGLAEVHANITNTQWYLGIYLLLVLISDPRLSTWWRAHDYAVLVITGLSSPFVIFMVPAYLQRLSVEGGAKGLGLRRLVAPFSLVFFGLVLVQTAMILTTAATARIKAPLGVDILTLAHVVVAHTFLGFLAYPNFANALQQADLFVSAIFFLGLGVVGYVLWASDWQMRAVLSFTIVTLAAALIDPQIAGAGTRWALLAISGERYFIVPNIAWMATLVAVCALVPSLRLGDKHAIVAAAVLAALCLPTFRISELPDENFPAQVKSFYDSAPGTEVSLAVLPPGWKMKLIRR
jgi:hypothetical protein